MKKILIYRPEHIGDYGLIVPMILAIKKKFPNAKIDLVVGPWNKDFAKATPGINKIIIFENPLVKKHLTYLDIIKIILFKSSKIIRHIRELNSNRYDIFINFSDRKYNRFIDKLIDVKKKIIGTNYPYIGEREPKRMEKIIKKELDIKEIPRRAKLNYSKEDKKIVEKLITKIEGKKILMHAIAELPEKNWPIERWIELINKITEEDKKINILIIGGPMQKLDVEKLISYCKNKKRLYNFAGKTNVVQSIYLIEKSNIIVGGDSGPVHWAELTKTPILTLYGPTDEKRWGPPEDQGEYIKDDINNIPVEDVFKKIKKLIL